MSEAPPGVIQRPKERPNIPIANTRAAKRIQRQTAAMFVAS
jgi:hypothetical protein